MSQMHKTVEMFYAAKTSPCHVMCMLQQPNVSITTVLFLSHCPCLSCLVPSCLLNLYMQPMLQKCQKGPVHMQVFYEGLNVEN